MYNVSNDLLTHGVILSHVAQQSIYSISQFHEKRDE